MGEISSLCTILDADGSGSVSVAEILEFLGADVNICLLQEQCSATTKILEQMYAAQKQSILDLRCKTTAWKLDEACMKVTAIKGLELDGLKSLQKSGNLGSPSSTKSSDGKKTSSWSKPGTAEKKSKEVER